MEWIRVEDGKPDKWIPVLIYYCEDSYEKYSLAFLDWGNRWLYYNYPWKPPIRNVTHWAVLPEFPKKQEE